MNRLAQLFLAVLFTCSLQAQKVASLQTEAPLPVDTNVHIGQLDNGLKYYIRENGKPENRAVMRLVVNAGSLQETDQQRGLAHFVEHMCFNGTKHFEKNELVNFLEKMGIKFGADLNAYTSFGETVYKLFIPTDKPGLLDTAYMVLEDWAHNVSFDHEEIDKERGVIVEEWRMGLGAEDRMMKEYLPELLKGSRYAERLPIGKMEIVKNSEYPSLISFYEEWYRPELMAVIVVGDVDIRETEQKIKDHFSGIQNPPDPDPRKEYPIPDNQGPLISVTTDPEAVYNVVQLFIKHDKRKEIKVSDYREFFKIQLMNSMLNTRYSEILQQPGAPFIYASSGYGGFLGRAKDAYTSTAVAKEGKMEESFKTLLLENEKVRQYGFTLGELERTKKDLLRSYEQALKEADKTESRTYASEYKRNYLEKEPIPGIHNEYTYANTFVPGIELDEVNQMAREMIIDYNWAILVKAPEKEGVAVPTKDRVKELIRETGKMEVEPYQDEEMDAPLLDKKPMAGKVKSKKHHEKGGFTEVVFENGATVILKPNDYKNDQLLFSAFSPGGHSVYPDSLFMNAKYTASVISMSGIGPFNSIQLQKKLAGNTASMSPWINSLQEGLEGNCSPSDLETLLKLNYLYFTGSRVDTSAFQSFISRIENQVANLKANPRYVFRDTLVNILTSNHPRKQLIPTKEDIAELDMGTIHEIFKDRFGNAGDFTFLFVGNFEEDSIMPLLEKYIGSLPSTGQPEKWQNVEPTFPEGIVDFALHKGMEPKSLVVLAMNGKLKWKYEGRLHFSLLDNILSIKLRQSMREEKSGVYGVGVSTSTEKFPDPEYDLQVSFGCSPENVDSLIEMVFLEMKRLQDEGPTREDLVKVKETAINDREVAIEKNTYWINHLENHYFRGDDIISMEEFKKLIGSVSAKDIQKAAKRYFTMDKYVRAVLYPGKGE